MAESVSFVTTIIDPCPNELCHVVSLNTTKVCKKLSDAKLFVDHGALVIIKSKIAKAELLVECKVGA